MRVTYYNNDSTEVVGNGFEVNTKSWAKSIILVEQKIGFTFKCMGTGWVLMGKGDKRVLIHE